MCARPGVLSQEGQTAQPFEASPIYSRPSGLHSLISITHPIGSLRFLFILLFFSVCCESFSEVGGQSPSSTRLVISISGFPSPRGFNRLGPSPVQLTAPSLPLFLSVSLVGSLINTNLKKTSKTTVSRVALYFNSESYRLSWG
ncbi:hypothetical protein [Phaffia rhodozyma]|uniref:Uncharacterized protein n=1 Tax=Phaffia rhodozyma TaxID=264483 RepID=A0A0F7SJ15_PHARH|nr:hypothetical protein [Phaffia rhodozyma]